jgi:hypothetical protein
MDDEEQEEAERTLSESIHEVLTEYILSHPENAGISDTRIILGALSRVLSNVLERAMILDELDEALDAVDDTVHEVLSLKNLRKREKFVARNRHQVVDSDTIANRRRAGFKIIAGDKPDDEIPD